MGSRQHTQSTLEAHVRQPLPSQRDRLLEPRHQATRLVALASVRVQSPRRDWQRRFVAQHLDSIATGGAQVVLDSDRSSTTRQGLSGLGPSIALLLLG